MKLPMSRHYAAHEEKKGVRPFYQAQPKRKRKRANLKFAKMKEGLSKQMADKAVGLNYETGLGMKQSGEDGAELQDRAKVAVGCKVCGASTHKTKRSSNCKYYGWADDRLRSEMVRINILNATTDAVDPATVEEGSEVHSEGESDCFFIRYDTDHMTLCCD
jgi:hypothetical protein